MATATFPAEHLPVLLRYARKLLKCPEDAEDAVQAVVLRLLERGYPLTRPLMLRAVRNEAYDRWRSRRAHPMLSLDYVYGAGDGEPATLGALLFAADDVEAAYLASEQYAAVVEALEGDKDGALLVLDALGYKDREMAAGFGCPDGTIKVRLHRARQRLAVVA